MENKKILIIEDDVDLVAMLRMYLKTKNLEVIRAYNSEEIPKDLSKIDLIILDINLPECDGFFLCQEIRKRWTMPILFLSARTNEQDKIRGLMLGGDDYITKPFSLEELYARIHANLKRVDLEHAPLNDSLCYLKAGVCKLKGVEIELTKSECEIVELLMSHPKQVFSKDRIYDLLWGIDNFGNPQVISEHIRNIRNKFSEVCDEDLIKTHWGIGYSWIG